MRRANISLGLSLVALIASSGVALVNPVSAAPDRSTYLVTFVDGTNPRAEAAALRAQNYAVSHVYENLFPGVAVELPAAAAQALANNPRVALIEPDGVATISETQTSATWGLDRVDQRALPLDSSFTYPANPGAGVEVHVIDTGVLASHVDFGGRVRSGYTAFNDGRGSTDCNGHGTHVAGTSAGSQWGLAKAATIVAVRVLDCNGSGSWSGVLAGMDWTAKNHTKPAVANMSLGGGINSTIDNAVQAMVDAGVTVAIAAGNSNANACNYSPARAASAITVGSTTSTDTRSSFSNFGSCVDIFAPGSSITSAWYTSNTATSTISGTSMASPHVAGAAAIVLGQSPSSTPAQVASTLVNASTTGVVTSAGTGSPNRLLYSEPGPTEPQVLSISTSSLPSGRVSVAYSTTLRASGGTGTYTWTLNDAGGSGLALSSAGVLSGTPATAGTFTLSVSVNDGLSTVTQSLSLTIAPPAVLPGAFSKSTPSNGASGISRSSARLTWAASANATSYRVCLSTSSACNTWYGPFTSTEATFSGLRGRTVYYWQVEARTNDGWVLANSGTNWRFTTAR